MPIDFEVIGIGLVANDGTGDKGRVSFDKVNDNFGIAAAAIEDAERKCFVIPITGEEEEVEAGRFVKFQFPYSFVLLAVRATVNTPESGTDIEIDINSGGTIFRSGGGDLTIYSGSTSTIGNSPQPDVNYVILNDGDWITITVTAAASGGTATGLKVYLTGYVIWTTF